MAERRRRPDLPPRWLTLGQGAQYLGHSPSWLTLERLFRLRETGFPCVNPSLERIDREPINDWSDRRKRRQGASPAPGHLDPMPPEGARFADPAKIRLRKQRPARRARLCWTIEPVLVTHTESPGLSPNVR
jgi:hypothetical protein